MHTLERSAPRSVAPPVTLSRASAHDESSLCAELLSTVDALSRRRADLLDEQLVDQFVQKGWLYWNAGALRVTPVGARVCDAVLLAYA